MGNWANQGWEGGGLGEEAEGEGEEDVDGGERQQEPENVAGHMGSSEQFRFLKGSGHWAHDREIALPTPHLR